MAPPPVTLFDLLEFLPLFVGKINSNSLMGFRHDLADAPRGIAAHFLELCSGLIDNRRHFGNLFGRQIELRAKSLLHSGAHQSWMMKLKEKVPCV